MKPQQLKAILKDITERGWVKDGDVFYTPSQAAALGLDNKPKKKTRSKVVKTGWIDDTRNIKNKLRIDTFTMLCKKVFDVEVWPEFYFTTERQYRLDYSIPIMPDGREVKISIEVNGGVWAKGNSGHSSGKGLLRDYDKQNHLQQLGWKTITVTPDQLMTNYTLDKIRSLLQL